MKKCVSKDEWWPVYSLEDFPHCGGVPMVEVSEELLARVESAEKEFQGVQRILCGLYADQFAKSDGKTR